MNRKVFAQKLALLGVCPFVIQNLNGSELTLPQLEQDEKYVAIQKQKQFVENWLTDLIDSMDRNLDRETQEKIV